MNRRTLEQHIQREFAIWPDTVLLGIVILRSCSLPCWKGQVFLYLQRGQSPGNYTALPYYFEASKTEAVIQEAQRLAQLYNVFCEVMEHCEFSPQRPPKFCQNIW